MECYWCHSPLKCIDVKFELRKSNIIERTFKCLQCGKTVSVDIHGQCSWRDRCGNLIHASHDKH